jgi:CDP-glucose 4,6-dehydratase
MAMSSLKPLTQSNNGGKILVTGHTGFKGSWLVMLLHKLGFETVGISLPPMRDSLYERLDTEDRPSTEYFVDIRDRAQIASIISTHSFSYVFHLAAQPLVLDSYKNPIETFATNVMGTANVLDALLSQKNLQAIGVVTTDKVYKNDETGKRFVEGDQLGGKDPYSASKVGTETVAKTWRDLSKLNNGPRIMTLRAGNVIGGGDFADNRLLPDIVRSYLNDIPIEIRNLDSTRPWQHVLDPLIGYVLAVILYKDTELEALNFGPDEASLSVSEVVRIAESAWERPLIKKVSKHEQKLEALKLELDSSMAKSILGWRPSLTQYESIYSTINWWKKLSRGDNTASSLCHEDISSAIQTYS